MSFVFRTPLTISSYSVVSFFFVSFFISFTLATVAAGKHQRQRESNSLVSERLVDGETPTFIYEIIQTRHTKSYSSISTA
jgi:hypothetical protein